MNDSDNPGQTALMSAAYENLKTAVIRVLLDSGADVNGGCPDGTAALHWACDAGNAEAVALLLEHGADANRHSSYVGSPWQLAGNNAAIRDLLRAAGGRDPAAREEILSQTHSQEGSNA